MVPNAFFYCLPIQVTGEETEGGPGSLAEESGGVYALNLGTVIPPSGTQIVVVWVESRWVFRYDG